MRPSSSTGISSGISLTYAPIRERDALADPPEANLLRAKLNPVGEAQHDAGAGAAARLRSAGGSASAPTPPGAVPRANPAHSRHAIRVFVSCRSPLFELEMRQRQPSKKARSISGGACLMHMPRNSARHQPRWPPDVGLENNAPAMLGGHGHRNGPAELGANTPAIEPSHAGTRCKAAVWPRPLQRCDRSSKASASNGSVGPAPSSSQFHHPWRATLDRHTMDRARPYGSSVVARALYQR